MLDGSSMACTLKSGKKQLSRSISHYEIMKLGSLWNYQLVGSQLDASGCSKLNMEKTEKYRDLKVVL